ncbi:hypothetical protein [Agrobacterium tumefaciens]|uniref:hypothetical protein n=1 Tax=Agrobacterium tumefaciens TaxID=358 RepID=UPI0015732C25|nr:hypothetical protein [Agrobacterium tumefaciens]
MPDMEKGVFDPDKIAEALNRAADEWKPSKLTLKDKLGEPKVYEAIKNLKRRGASGSEIVAILESLGIKTTPQSLNATLGKIDREARGDSDAKPKRERKTNKPSEGAGTSTETSGGTPKQSEGKPSDKQGDKPAKSEGRKLNQPPSMGGAFDQNNL